MSERRIARINSLLQEVITDVVRLHVKDPNLPQFVTITGVSTTRDLGHATVLVSVLGTATQKTEALRVLNRAAGFIAQVASKQVVLRYFPHLVFKIDDALEYQLRMEETMQAIKQERQNRVTDA